MNSVLATISGDYAALIQKALPLQVNTAPSLQTPRVSGRLRTTHRQGPSVPASSRRRSYFITLSTTIFVFMKKDFLVSILEI